MPETIRDLRFRFDAARPLHARTQTVALSSAALPRISRLMALAIQLEGLLDQHPELDAKQVARRGSVSRSRMTQILNLLWLAPDIQERLLWLPPLTKGREVITEKSLRRLAGELDWGGSGRSFKNSSPTALARRPWLAQPHTPAS